MTYWWLPDLYTQIRLITVWRTLPLIFCLGKPCLIVSHHDFFKDDCAKLIELIEKLRSLKCSSTLAPIR